MSWQAIPVIGTLQHELDQHFPHRVTPDWIIGDADHSSRVSDHNPAPDGDVHAIDIRFGGDFPGFRNGRPSDEVKELLKAVIGDPRVWYVIFNRKIYSRTYDWEARYYSGADPHTGHVHVSFRYETKYENMTGKPFFEERKVRTKPAKIDLSHVRDQFLIALGEEKGNLHECPHIKRVQRALNVRDDADLKVDGWVGDHLLNAWGDWERDNSVPGSGRPRVPDAKSLGKLVQPRWRMV